MNRKDIEDFLDNIKSYNPALRKESQWIPTRDAFRQLCQLALKGLDAQEYVPQQAAWVACSERLPTHEYSVLLFVTDCATQVAPFREIGIYNTKTGRFQINGGDDDIEVEVSHWADLPEPPGAQQCEPHESL
jgi:hypothetical protein